MPAAVSVLQLDTGFPRVPGDVSCPATYRGETEILRVPDATVGRIVSDRPDLIDIAPFERALAQATGDVVATSCGFLSYWQVHLAARTPRPFVSSALTALARLAPGFAPGDILIVTFDAARLGRLHFGAYGSYASGVVGLPPDLHLRQVIEGDAPTLDMARAGRELADCVGAALRPHHRHILLECTNLPPYKPALRQITDLPISDILTEIDARMPGTVQPRFLSAGAGA